MKFLKVLWMSMIICDYPKNFIAFWTCVLFKKVFLAFCSKNLLLNCWTIRSMNFFTNPRSLATKRIPYIWSVPFLSRINVIERIGVFIWVSIYSFIKVLFKKGAMQFHCRTKDDMVIKGSFFIEIHFPKVCWQL